ncbi:MAG: gluconate 2-dehydrogenase subunit 3 family protein [Cyclobacteriaceae bacterium]|nr:gluconate 2-dehydrogenase subunit 3 family protein [Cyclobacteriaceae bacterium]
MMEISRRDSLKYITLAGISAGLVACQPGTVEKHEGHTHEGAPADDNGFVNLSEEDRALLNQKFFTDHERETVRVLGNLIIPADDRSGNAEDALVPGFIEFMMLDQPNWQTPMRGGLKWLDNYCLKLFNKSFTDCSEGQQTQVLDAIAYPDIAAKEVSQGVSFFNLIRNFVASGFWSSKMGVEDIGYIGNTANNWQGAPQEWLDKLGVSYEDA